MLLLLVMVVVVVGGGRVWIGWSRRSGVVVVDGLVVRLGVDDAALVLVAAAVMVVVIVIGSPALTQHVLGLA